MARIPFEEYATGPGAPASRLLAAGSRLARGLNVDRSTIPADGTTPARGHFASEASAPHVYTVARASTTATTTAGPATPTLDPATGLYWTELPVTSADVDTITITAEVQGQPGTRASEAVEAVTP